MLISKVERLKQPPSRKSKGRQQRRLPGGIIVALLVLLAAGGFAVWQQQSQPAVTAEIEGNALLHDFGEVWGWVDPAMDGGAKAGQWSFRLDGQWTRGQTEWLAGALGISLAQAEDGSVSGTRTSGSPAYEVKLWFTPNAVSGSSALSQSNANEGQETTATTTTTLTDQRTTEQVSAVVLLQFEKGIDRQSLGDAVNEVEQAAITGELNYQGGFAVRGVPKAAGNKITEALVKQAAAIKREGYDDGHTVSNTYTSPKLHAGVDSGGVRVNMQVATVAKDEHAEAELIVGVPLITGDYRTPN